MLQGRLIVVVVVVLVMMKMNIRGFGRVFRRRRRTDGDSLVRHSLYLLFLVVMMMVVVMIKRLEDGTEAFLHDTTPFSLGTDLIHVNDLGRTTTAMMMVMLIMS